VRQGIIASADVSTLAGTIEFCSAGCTAGTACSNDVCLPPGGGAPRGGGSADGVGTAASFYAPFSIAFHYPSGSLFLTDGNNTIPPPTLSSCS